MPDTATASSGAVVAGMVISLVVLLIWALQLVWLSDLDGSDAAGNGLARAFTAIAIIILWALLASLAITAYVKGAMPIPWAVAALILIPVAFLASWEAADLLARPGIPPFYTPIVIPALAPPLIVAFCIWALLPALRGVIPMGVVAASVWGVVLILSIAIVPLTQMRQRADDQETARRAKWADDFAALPGDAPLWDWTPFLAGALPDGNRVDAVLDGIRHLARRQSEAETMLDRGDFPLGYLARLDLEPTPAICDKTRALLRKRVPPLVLASPNSRPYADIADDVADAVAAMEWLVGYGCACDAEAQQWEAMAKNYRDTNFDVYRLAELRDPASLGRTLREAPERFSMLTPRAHLKAWLKFADDPASREAALAGARQLDHRTSDAIEMLHEDEFTAATLLRHLPALDLEPTPPLCDAALTVLHGRFEKIYRPKPDDPRSYDELLGRLSFGGAELPALISLARSGCDASAELGDADALVRAYQDSPDRAAMLATLTQLRRAP